MSGNYSLRKVILNTFKVFLVIVLHSGCQQDTKEWHKAYVKYKCDYKNLVEERDRSEKKQFEILMGKRDSIQSVINNKFKIQKLKIQSLKIEITKVEKSYLAKYKKVQDEQSLKHGHVSTPAYEKKIQQLDDNRTSKTESLVQRLKKEEAYLLATPEYTNLKSTIDSIEIDLKNIEEDITDIFKPRLDSLQELVNNHRIYGKELKKSLNEKDARGFQTLMDSINSDPCKYVK